MNDPTPLFDTALIRRRLVRARTAGYAGFLMERILDDVEDRLAAVTRSFPLALDLGSLFRSCATACVNPDGSVGWCG